MRTGYPLRFYASPVKLLMLMAIGLVFAGAGYWLKFHHGSRWSGYDVFMDYAVLVFGALCIIVFLLVFLYSVVLRHPVLEINAMGWQGRSFFFAKAQVVSWQDMRDVVVLRQPLSYGNRAYYLVVNVKDPSRLSHGRMRAFSARIYRSLASAGMVIQINLMFARATPAKIDELLKRIAETCGYELHLYGVTLHRDISPM